VEKVRVSDSAKKKYDTKKTEEGFCVHGFTKGIIPITSQTQFPVWNKIKFPQLILSSCLSKLSFSARNSLYPTNIFDGTAEKTSSN